MLLAKTLRSSTFRLALIAIATFGVIVSAMFSYVYLSTAAYVTSRSDRAIAVENSRMLDARASAGREGLIDLIRRRTADKSFADHVYALVDSSSALLAGNLKEWPAGAAVASGWIEFRRPASPSNAERMVRARIETLPEGDRLLIGEDISDLDGFATGIKAAVIEVGVLLLVLAGFVSVLVTRRTVGRIESISATSREIMLAGLDRRIPLRGTGDEWDRVADNLNQMLDRIETLVREVKQVSDNVAHDLRTPLTRMRARLEKACHADRDDERDQLLIGDTIAELDSVLRMFASITRIAEIETQARKRGFHAVNLADIAGAVVELYDAAAEQDDTRLTLVGDGEVTVTGDRDLLFDAIANLVDNAIKHGRAGGQVVVACRNAEGGAVVSVADDGPGIPAEQHEHVFKRFYRLERSRYTPGNGLGLSLVAAVARLHCARIDMRDNGPGLLFELSFSAVEHQRYSPAN